MVTRLFAEVFECLLHNLVLALILQIRSNDVVVGYVQLVLTVGSELVKLIRFINKREALPGLIKYLDPFKGKVPVEQHYHGLARLNFARLNFEERESFRILEFSSLLVKSDLPCLAIQLLGQTLLNLPHASRFRKLFRPAKSSTEVNLNIILLNLVKS